MAFFIGVANSFHRNESLFTCSEFLFIYNEFPFTYSEFSFIIISSLLPFYPGKLPE